MRKSILLFVLILCTTLSLSANDIWYKTDFPENEQVVMFSRFGNFVLTDQNNIYQSDDSLHWEMIKHFTGDTIPNSVCEVSYGADNALIGTNYGLFSINNGSITQMDTSFMSNVYVHILRCDYGKCYYNFGGNGLFKITLYNSKIDTIHFFDEIKLKKLRIGFKMFAISEDGETYEGDSYGTFKKYIRTLPFEGKVNDFADRNYDCEATTQGFFINMKDTNYLPGINCLEIAQNDFEQLSTVYDPNATEFDLASERPYIATEQNGVYFWNLYGCHQINGGLTDTNLTHIVMSNGFHLKVSTKSQGIFINERTTLADVQDDNNDEKLLILAPNPTISLIIAKSKNDKLISSIQVFDIFGNMVLESNGNQSAELNLDLSSLPVGTYYCKAVIGGKISVKKIMKI